MAARSANCGCKACRCGPTSAHVRLPAHVTPPACAVGAICPTLAAKEDQPVATPGHPGGGTGKGFRIREASMSVSTSVRRGLLVAGSFVVLAAAGLPLAAQQQAPAPAGASTIPPMSQGRPGFSPIDQTK